MTIRMTYGSGMHSAYSVAYSHQYRNNEAKKKKKAAVNSIKAYCVGVTAHISGVASENVAA